MQYGKIQSRRPVLPRDDSDLCRRGSLSTSCFRAGDGRLSEQPALISLHIIFLRMHNRIATLLSALNHHWSDERIFQESRKIIGALVQHITYREFLPIVLGKRNLLITASVILRTNFTIGYYR
jgi:peroxidase